jgi:RNA polymerase sigma-70 factor (ECF subfamily)
MPRTKPAIFADMSDEHLVHRAQGGDREAFRAIMTRCNQRLFRVARSIVRDDHEAEDVLQEAYLRAFRAIAGFRGEANILTWLTRITVNEARARLRQRRDTVGVDQIEAAQQAGAQVIPFPSAAGFGATESAVESAHIRRLVEAAIDDLPDTFRTVFMLRDVDGCSIEETAATLGVRPETVKTRLHRARRLLRETLDQRLKATLADAFSFLGPACQAITEAVLLRLSTEGRMAG